MSDRIQTLVVDDDEGVRFFLTQVLSEEDHHVITASEGKEALAHLRTEAFDLVILDLKLGGRIGGLRVLQAVSWRWPQTARIILTGHGTLDSAQEAILEGVDAYLLKPVKAQEIRQVIADVLRKRRSGSHPQVSSTPPADPNRLERNGFAVDLERSQVMLDGHPLDLTAHEYELLVYLVQNDDRPVSPPELVKVVRGYDCDNLQEARDIIKWYVYRLRGKVEPKPSSPRHILNVRGVGYIFKA